MHGPQFVLDAPGVKDGRRVTWRRLLAVAVSARTFGEGRDRFIGVGDLPGRRAVAMSLLEPYAPGMDYGVGWDTVMSEPRGDAVVRTDAEEMAGARGQNAELRLVEIERQEDLQDELGISVETSGRYGLWKASASLDFIKTSNFNSQSYFLYVGVDVGNAFRQMRDIKFRPEAWRLLENGRGQRFREQFGDVVITGMATGGIFRALLEVETTEEGEKEEISASVGVGRQGIGFSLDVKAEFEMMIERVVSNRSFSLTSSIEGGDTTFARDAGEIIDKALRYPETVAGDRAKPFMVQVKDYKVLDHPEGPNWVDVLNAREVMDDLMRDRLKLQTLRNDVDAVLKKPDRFERPNLAMLAESREEINSALDDIMAAASLCVNSIKDCRRNVPAVSVALPSLRKRKRTGRRGASFDPRIWEARRRIAVANGEPDPGPQPWRRAKTTITTKAGPRRESPARRGRAGSQFQRTVESVIERE